MTDLISTHYDLLVVVALLTFMAVLAGVSIEDALKGRRG
ncbi:hypothetical protein BV98_002829 [Sphingobium herbicidovorans NBRC 16415]|uniref:Uncharacterized protein n=1 Tax=Sphingobium herbicidovorans (strain ATCC 700291 / DSM 11019 / CCUG 56400 / KCTC 2939 / LMG 18315 / NBRC 16415 / MH) TaxID=1219045 RepID=A0A086P7M2_SPHHM|nr:hypothetical protein BV98_002829 [Sphingobium herbicidovorans NBRC 16415]